MAPRDVPRRLPGRKWLRTWWLASVTGGPFLYSGRERRDAQFDLTISPAVCDEVAAAVSATLDDGQAPEREKRKCWPPWRARRGQSRLGLRRGAVNWQCVAVRGSA